MNAPLRLRQVGRTAAASWRQLACRREALPFDWLDAQWQVHFCPLDRSRHGLMTLDIDWGGSPVLAKIDQGWAAQVGRQVLQVDDLRRLPPDLQPIVIEAAFGDLAELVESTTRKRFSLRAVEQATEAHTVCRHGVGFTLDDGDTAIHGELWLDDTGLGYLASAVRQVPLTIAGQDWGALPVPVRFCAGWTDLSLAGLRQLQRRDVVLLDECWLGSGLDRIVVTMGRLGALASISGTQVTILEEPGEIMEELDEQGVEEGTGFGDLPVRLHFDLGERQLTLSELMVLGPGHVFDLGRELRRAVIIRANGKVIGEGELVDIDGQVGVAVLSLTPPASE
ncbi:MAG: hypothetical protein RL404_444 [Pseudomonadota bacterium]